MGHNERQRILKTRTFVSHLVNLDIPSGCLHSAIVAMGGAKRTSIRCYLLS